MLTDVVGGIGGRLGDASIYSFHKMLPVFSGGAAVLNDPASPLAGKLGHGSPVSSCLHDFDLQRIAAKRRENGLVVDQLVRELLPDVEPLFGLPGDGEVPQTYPVLIPDDSRDRLYHEMNAAGFGVVSLYHTLISQIPPDSFPATSAISRHILNLPVHQDASEPELCSMVRKLASLVNG
jgi:dTDP-4-amino-4,6-dideoxygalactose transaminase